MEISGVVDGSALVGYLQAALAHAEVHGVHVDLARVGLICCCFRHVGIYIFVDGHLNIDLLTSSFSYGLRQTSKSGVVVNGFVYTEY